MVLKLAVIVCASIFVNVSGAIPNYIHICKRSDPEASKCIQESIEFIRPHLRNGIPELDVPKLEPLKIPGFDLGGSPTFKAMLKDIDTFGASDFQLHKLKLNIPTLTFRIQVVIPVLRLVGRFDINAQILVVPFKGEGNFFANATNCLGTAVLKAELNEQNGEKHLHFTKLDLKLQIGDYNIRLENSNNVDRTLIQAANEILNQNRREFLEIATPFIERRVSGVLLEIANKIVKKFKYDEVFPEK